MNITNILTDRLILKELKLGDATLLISKIYTKENTKYLYRLNNPSLEEMVAYLGEVTSEYKKKKPTLLCFGITSNDVLVGLVGIEKTKREHACFELSYIMDPMYQRMGFTYEAVLSILDFAKKNKIKKMIAHADAQNIPSINLLEKAGFKRENEINPRIYADGSKSFELLYSKTIE